VQPLHEIPIEIKESFFDKSQKEEIEFYNDTLDYILGISPKSPDGKSIYYFNVWIERTISNRVAKIFYAKSVSYFSVMIPDDENPSVEFFYALISKSNEDFAKQFYNLVVGNFLESHKTPPPNLQQLSPLIQSCIDKWNMSVRKISMN